MKFAQLVLILCVLEVVLPFQLPPLVHGRPRGGFLGDFEHDEDLYSYTEDDYFVEGAIDQLIDHFNESNKATYKQYFQFNNKFFNRDRPLVFLMIGGEGPIADSEKWVRNENVSMMKWAAEFGAAAFQVEHRFYGQSRPFPFSQQTTEALKFLTIEQVLADLKGFINQMNALLFNGLNPRWITFGGSYPGSLSAWFRATYPEMTIAAVSSSSAVNVRVDYYGYAVNTEANYRDVSLHCSTYIGLGMRMIINDAYKSDVLRSALTSGYNLCNDFIGDNFPKAVQFFASNIYAVFQDINQYSGDNRNAITNAGLDLEHACEHFYGTGYASVMIKRVIEWYNTMYNNTDCMPNNYTEFVTQLSTPDYVDLDLASYRTWIWQTCTFLGYFQTTDGGNRGIFQSSIPLDFYVDQCIDIFGPEFTADYIFDAVARTQTVYGGDKGYKGTKVVFPNGSIDPWKSLGKLTPNPQNDVDAFIINGTAHCADMYPARDTDLPSLVEGRNRIHDLLARWIEEGFNNAMSTSTTTSPPTNSTQQTVSTTVPLLSTVVVTPKNTQQPSSEAPPGGDKAAGSLSGSLVLLCLSITLLHSN